MRKASSRKGAFGLRPGETVHFSYEKKPLSLPARQVLERLTQGESNKEIAESLNIKPQTVKNHIRRRCARMGVDGPHARVDLVSLHGLMIKEAPDNVAADKAWASLTLYQQRIESLLILGLTQPHITEMTGLNARAIRDALSGVSGIYEKIGVCDRLELFIWHVCHRFVEWFYNEPTLFYFPNSQKYGVTFPNCKRRHLPVGIHDRDALMKGTTNPKETGFTLIELTTDTKEICRKMGISAKLFPCGLLARSRKRSGRSRTRRG